MDAQRDPIKEVTLIATLLDKCVRQLMLYGRKHPQFLGAQSDFMNRLEDFLKQSTSLKLSVRRGELEYGDITVFRLEKRDSNYIHDMYSDGIRDLEFLTSVSEEEITEFISVLGRDVQGIDVREDDTVTLLWKKGLKNIRTQTIDIYASDKFAFIQQDQFEESPEKDKQERDYFDSFLKRALVEFPAEKALPSPIDTKSIRHKAFATDVQKPVPVEFIKPTAESREEMSSWLAAAQGKDIFPEVATVFAEVLEAEVQSSDFRTLVKAYCDLIAAFLSSRDLVRSREWLRRLRGIQAHLGAQRPDIHAWIDEEIEAMASPLFFRSLGEKGLTDVTSTPEDWLEFFRYLGPKTTSAICELLAFFKQETFHAATCDFLIANASDRIETFTSNLAHVQWNVTRDMVRILGSLLSETAAQSVLGKMAVHPQAEVRMEVLRATRRFAGDFGKSVLRRGLNDPNKEVRTLTYRMIAKSDESAFAKPIADLFSKEAFLKRTPDEKRMAAMTLARISIDKSIPFFSQILDKDSDSDDELRTAALYGLAAIDSVQSKRLLNELAEGKLDGKVLRETATRLLERSMQKASIKEEDPLE